MSGIVMKVPANCVALHLGHDDVGLYLLVRREDGTEEKLREPQPPSPITFTVEMDSAAALTDDESDITVTGTPTLTVGVVRDDD